MENTDYSKWELVDLLKAGQEIKKAIEGKKNSEKKKMIEELKDKAQSLGVPLSEIIEDIKRVKKTVTPKYCNPENNNETWSGRGRKPGWFVKCMEEGKEKKDLLIK